MTKEDIESYISFSGSLSNELKVIPESVFYEFLESNVCIPRGTNPHPYADVLHTYIEDVTQTLEYLDVCSQWETFIALSAKELRIKPSEAVYEYKVRMTYSDGSYEDTERYFTSREFNDFGFPTTCLLEDSTKRERK
jgi:hypothetical protein